MAEKAEEPSLTPTPLLMIEELKTIAKWDKLNLLMMNLGLKKHEMEKIENDYAGIDNQKIESFSSWLRQTPDASWKDIIVALRKIGEKTLASKLEKDYKWKEPRSQSVRTYIQTIYKDEPIKVSPASETVSKIHLKKQAISSGWYQIVQGNLLHRSSFRPKEWIQENIKMDLHKFMSRIDEDENKHDFRVGYEARFGRQYQMLQEGSERLRACSVKKYVPNLIKHNKKQFHSEIYHDIRQILDNYCDKSKGSRQITVIDPFKFVLEGQEAGLYIAVIEEVKHGVFMLKAVYRQPNDQTNSAKYDIVLPGSRYDIRIGDNCGPLIPVTRESISYRVAEDITMGMKRKRRDRRHLSLAMRGETSKKESKFYVRYFRQKIQTQYHWKGNDRWILAKYEVDTAYDVYDANDAERRFPELNKEYDFEFKPEQRKVELELWNEKIYPKDVDKTRPTRDEYWHMQSCKTPLFLPGEGVPVPPRPWTADGLMEDFDEFLQAAFNVAECLETSAALEKSPA